MHAPHAESHVRPPVPGASVAPRHRSFFVMRATACFETLCREVSRLFENGEIRRAHELGEARDAIDGHAVDLLVIDHALDPSRVAVLIWHQQRVRPGSRVLVFDDSPLMPDCGSYRVWSWSDAPAVLRSTVDHRIHRDSSATKARA